MHKKGLEARLANKASREALAKSMEAWAHLKKTMPEVSPLDIMEMAMMTALAEGDFDEATRFANMLAPYKAAKLASVEQTIKTDIRAISDEELRKLIAAEGLKLPSSNVLEQIEQLTDNTSVGRESES